MRKTPAAESGLGTPMAQQSSIPGIGLLCWREIAVFGGWSLRLTSADLGPRSANEAAWPADAAAYLLANYRAVEEEMGVWPTTDYISGPLYDQLWTRFEGVIGAGQPVTEDALAAPLAVQGAAPESGLFPFDKYSSAYLLLDTIREDIGRRWRNNIDAWRRLMLLPRSQVVSLKTSGNRVTEVELLVNGQQQFLGSPLLSPDCTVVMAASTIESTRLALDSVPPPAMGTNRMGSNLMAHLRSDITARIRRSAIPGLPANLLVSTGTSGSASRCRASSSLRRVSSFSALSSSSRAASHSSRVPVLCIAIVFSPFVERGHPFRSRYDVLG
ncbi:MAG: hypothetical protein JWQ42_3429 [Edaphobacter sp.]|nr:hypothetical protein [Edaphobacter sp.]